MNSDTVPVSAETSTGGVFWKLENSEETFWNEYIATRPVYNDKILGPLLEYHRQHSNSFKSAIDIGAGPGEAAEALLPYFNHTVASDNDPRSLSIAMQRLTHVPKEKLSFTLSSGEEILRYHAPVSMDLVANAESFPLMDTEVSLNNFHTILRPGGTLAIWFYGRINFSNPDFRITCQPILDRILDLAFKRIVSGCSPEHRQTWKRAIDGMSSWLDYIPFDTAKWQDVWRHKWNPHFTLPFFGPDACDFEVSPDNNVGVEEKITSETDTEFWRRDLDSAGVRRFVKYAFPWPAALATSTLEMEDLFGELEIAMGGKDVKRAFSWPAVLIMASKRP